MFGFLKQPGLVTRPIQSRYEMRKPRASLWKTWQVDLKEPFDWINPLCMLVLATLGVAFIYSSQLAVGGNQWAYQIVWLAGGLVIYVLTAITDYRILLRLAPWLYGGSILALSGLLILAKVAPSIAPTRFGASRWIDLGAFSAQPSELAKVAILITICVFLSRADMRGYKKGFRALLVIGLLLGLPIVLILLQPDLGSAMVILPMTFAILFVSNLPARFFVIGAGLVGIVLGIVAWDIARYDRFLTENQLSPMRDRGVYEQVSWVPLFDYQRNRILAFVAPDRVDPLGIGWNLRQSLISIGSGGLTGKGWTEGTQARLGYLPRGVAHNDFIFPVLAEEIGFVGSVTVLTLFGVLLVNGIRIASNARDRLGLLLAVGVSTLFAVHIFVNIAMTVGLMPIKGLPLPMMSYGGSFILSCCFLQGIIQSVHRFRQAY
jgi:rod shape determining protein RodA